MLNLGIMMSRTAHCFRIHRSAMNCHIAGKARIDDQKGGREEPGEKYMGVTLSLIRVADAVKRY